jgi:hypothetical protein
MFIIIIAKLLIAILNIYYFSFVDGKSPKKLFFSTKKKQPTEDKNRLDLFEKTRRQNRKK